MHLSPPTVAAATVCSKAIDSLFIVALIVCWNFCVWTFFCYAVFRPNEKINVFRVTGLKSSGRIGTHIVFNYFFLEKMYDFMHFERHFAFQKT